MDTEPQEIRNMFDSMASSAALDQQINTHCLSEMGRVCVCVCVLELV